MYPLGDNGHVDDEWLESTFEIDPPYEDNDPSPYDGTYSEE